MEICKKVNEVKELVKSYTTKGLKIGFVPTMGYLHEGHMSLLKESKKENDITVMSIFVNPIQFGVNEDFSKYPRDMERDICIAKSEGVDIVLIPEIEEIYPKGFSTYVIEENLTGVLCGRSRPTHFRGVTTVVTKLLNIIKPGIAYFGQKDYQQFLIIKKIVKDLNMDIIIKACPIIREIDGLAMSSRNVYLNAVDRKRSTSLYKSLNEAKKVILSGEKSVNTVIEVIKKIILNEGKCVIDYIEVLNAENLTKVQIIENQILIALAVKYGNTRLIDNMVVEV